MAGEAVSEDRGGCFSEELEWGSREVTGGRSRRRRRRSGVHVKRGTKKGRELKRGTLFRKVGDGRTDGGGRTALALKPRRQLEHLRRRAGASPH